MYETLHTDGKTKGRIEYTVWSEIFSCPECAGKFNFIEEALDDETKRVRDSFPCPHCEAELTKARLERLLTSRIDTATGKSIDVPQRETSLTFYSVGKVRYEKRPTPDDLAQLRYIDSLRLPSEVPPIEIPPMHMTDRRARVAYAGILHIHYFYLPRAAQAMGHLWAKAKEHPDARIRSFLTFMVEHKRSGTSRYSTDTVLPVSPKSIALLVAYIIGNSAKLSVTLPGPRQP